MAPSLREEENEVEYRILGPLEVLDGARPVTISAAKPRALLAILLLHANELTPRDRLIDELWGTRPPNSAVNALQVYIGELRKALEPDRQPGQSGEVLISRSGGYLLRVRPGALDAERFEELFERGVRARAAGDPAAAARILREGLDLWRGATLADFTYEPFAQASIVRLEESRLATLEERIEADIELGSHGSVIGELESLVREHPLRERLHAQLMLALYRSGRQADALEIYRELRARLVEELGIEPGIELRRLHQKILEQDASLEAEAAAVAVSEEPIRLASNGNAVQPPALSPGPAGPIIGRRTELEQLQATYERTVSEGTVHLLTLLGQAGIGKTRLAQELVSSVSDSAMVIAGRCAPSGEGITFLPLAEAIRDLSAETPLETLLRDDPRAELIIQRLQEVTGRSEGSSGREEIFWAVRRLLGRAASSRPLLIVFEDIHWAEPTFLDLVEYLAEQERGARILILCLARPELHEERPDWSGGKPNAGTLLLGPLSDDAGRELIQVLGGQLSADRGARVLEAADGNPLFLEQILAMASELPPTVDELPIPATIQALLVARLDRLGPAEEAVLTRAAVIGREFPTEAVEEMLSADARSFVRQHLESLVRRDLLRPGASLGPESEGFRFGHGLIQQVAYRSVPKRTRAGLHEQFAAWLARAGGSDSELWESAGYHLEAAFRYRAETGGIGPAERRLATQAGERLAAAGELAFRRGDVPAALNLLGRADDLLEDDDPERVRRLPELGYALYEAGELKRSEEVLAEAIERGRAADDTRTEWRARAKLESVLLSSRPERADPEAIERESQHGIATLTELGDNTGLARAWVLLSEAQYMKGRLLAAEQSTLESAKHAATAGSHREEAWALGSHAMCLLNGPTPVRVAIDRLHEFLSEAETDPLMAVNLSNFLACQEAMLGEIDSARTRIAHSRKLTAEAGLGWQVGLQDLLSGYVETWAGDLEAAEADLMAACSHFDEIDDAWFLGTTRIDLARILFRRGRTSEAATLLAEVVVGPMPADREWRIKAMSLRALLLANDGNLPGAERTCRQAVELSGETDLLNLRADTLLDLAEILRARELEAARTSLAEAASLYERKGHTVAADAAASVMSR